MPKTLHLNEQEGLLQKQTTDRLGVAAQAVQSSHDLRSHTVNKVNGVRVGTTQRFSVVESDWSCVDDTTHKQIGEGPVVQEGVPVAEVNSQHQHQRDPLRLVPKREQGIREEVTITKLESWLSPIFDCLKDVAGPSCLRLCNRGCASESI